MIATAKPRVRLKLPFAQQSRTPARVQTIEAAYDAASMTGLMEGAWDRADNLSADEANDTGTRQILRSRSRYECHEANSFLKGAITTVVDVIVGRGPRLQMQFPGKDQSELNRQIESLWARWSKAVRYGEYLRTLVRAKIVDGEGFGIRTTSRTVPLGLPTLFPRNIEAERVSSFHATYSGPLQVDGLEIDDAGEPVRYFVYQQLGPQLIGQADPIDRAEITHLFRRDRPGQHRGVPELTTSLPLCNLLRQYTLATVTAARTAAKHSTVLESQASSVTADGQSLTPLEPFDSEEIDYDMATALPIGWKLSQLKAEQPTTSYEMFRDCVLGEIVRPLGAPLNMVLGSSAKWNYASTQADRINFENKTRLDRDSIEIEEVDRTFAAFWDECVLMGLIPEDLGPLDEIPHRWFWDQLTDADPQTLASARETNLKTGHASREQELNEAGIDIDAHDQAAAKALGLTVEQYRQILARSLFGQAVVDQVLSSSVTTTPIALNPAQIQGLTLIMQQVGQQLIDPLAARALAAAAFPAFKPEQLAGMFPLRAPTPPDTAPTPRDPTASPQGATAL